MKCLILLAIGALCLPAIAQKSAPLPAPMPSGLAKFDWKLRLAKGQMWTQTLSTQGTMLQAAQGLPLDPLDGLQQGARQTLVLQNEVLFVNPRYSILRATFMRFDQSTTFSVTGKGRSTPDRSKFTRAFIGVPLKIKLTNDGRIEAISGIQQLIARGRESILTLAKSKAERDDLLKFLPNVNQLHDDIIKCYRFALPGTLLAIGDSYLYDFQILPSYLLSKTVQIKRTLRTFDGKTAHFDDQLTFNTFGENPEIDEGVKTYNALTGNIAGHTTVDATTGWAQTELTLTINGKVTQRYRGNEKGSTFTTRENTHFSLSTK